MRLGGERSILLSYGGIKGYNIGWESVCQVCFLFRGGSGHIEKSFFCGKL